MEKLQYELSYTMFFLPSLYLYTAMGLFAILTAIHTTYYLLQDDLVKNSNISDDI